MKKILVAGFAWALALATQAAVQVESVSVRQLWPWSTDVKVDYVLSGIEAGTYADLTVKFYDGGVELDSSRLKKAIKGDLYGIGQTQGSFLIYRIMRALEYLKSFPEWDGRNLTASDGSMGGLQTMWAAGIDPDVSEARPVIPWCCDMGGRKTMKRNFRGWGSARPRRSGISTLSISPSA